MMFAEKIFLEFHFFLMVVVRLFAMFVIAPIFSSPIVTYRMRAILAITVSVVIFPILVIKVDVPLFENIWVYAFVLINEFVIGMSIGLIVVMIFTAFQLAGQFFSIQMGFGINEVFDPLSQISVPLAGQFLVLFSSLIFLILDGHLLIIESIYYSFIELSSFNFISFSGPIFDIMLEVFSDMFVIGLKISLPIMGTLFVVNFVMGLLAKFAPQINILMLGFPIYIVVGFLMLILLIALIFDAGKVIFQRYLNVLFEFFR